MAVYATYTKYTTDYLGTAIVSADFPRLALRASATIDQLTYNRVASVVTDGTDTDTIALIVMATCAVAEELQNEDIDGGSDGIQSESVGSTSVTYNAHSNKQLSNEAKQSKAAKLYLGLTGLMYRGFNADELQYHDL